MKDIRDYERELKIALATFSIKNPGMIGLGKRLRSMGFSFPENIMCWGRSVLIYKHTKVPLFLEAKVEAGHPWDGVWLHLYRDTAGAFGPDSEGKVHLWCDFLPITCPTLVAPDLHAQWADKIRDIICSHLAVKRMENPLRAEP